MLTSPSRLVELNIQHGGGKRIPTIVSWLDGQHADVIVLTEWRDNPGGRALLGLLHQAGYNVRGLTRGGHNNGLLFASRMPFAERLLTPNVSCPGKLAAFTLADGLTVVAAYLPQRYAQIPFLETFGRLAECASEPLLVLGDLNTGCNERDREPAGAPFHCSSQFRALSDDSDLKDLWRWTHGDDAREWTWHAAKTRNGFRIDHALGNAALLSRYPRLNCRYDHATRERRMTDHSAIILELDPAT